MRTHLLSLAAAMSMAALPTEATYGASYTPRPGTSERAEIMDAVRHGTHATSVFVVEFLKVVGDRSGKMAYVEVRPAQVSAQLPFEGWAFLTNIGGRWRVLWAIGENGASSCRMIETTHRSSLSLVARYEDGTSIFSPRFYENFAQASAGANDGLDCVGEVLEGD